MQDHQSQSAVPVSAQYPRINELARFRRLAAKVHPFYIDQLDYRRERQVYLLTNGERTIGQIATLLGLTSSEVAHMMQHLLERAYVEFVPPDEFHLP